MLNLNEINALYKEMSKNIFTKKVLEKTKPIEGAVETIKELSKKYEIYIVTARTEELVQHAKEWLEKYKIDKDIKEIISSSFEEKQDICKRRDIFFLCDDDVKHLKKRIIIRRILFDKEGMVKINKGDKNYEEIIVVNSWEEVGKVGLKLVY